MVIARSGVFYEGFRRTGIVSGSGGVKLFLPEAPLIAYQSQPCQGSHEPVNEFLSHIITSKIVYLLRTQLLSQSLFKKLCIFPKKFKDMFKKITG